MQELCQSQGIPFTLRPIAWDEVLAADEVMITSASKEVLPVTQLDGRPVGQGQPGPVWKRLHAAYQQAIADSQQAATA
jgi:D-alanine transaminase